LRVWPRTADLLSPPLSDPAVETAIGTTEVCHPFLQFLLPHLHTPSLLPLRIRSSHLLQLSNMTSFSLSRDSLSQSPLLSHQLTECDICLPNTPLSNITSLQQQPQHANSSHKLATT
jgi:hypothetical protein